MPYSDVSKKRLWAKEKRRRIKAVGGAEYEALRTREDGYRRAHLLRRDPQKYSEKARQRRRFFQFARYRFKARMADARRSGIEATIRFEDIYWPSHCPVLGIELDYKTPHGKRKWLNPANPSFDRWDNSKGYVTGNVFIISNRANRLKNDGSASELIAVALYAKRGIKNAIDLFQHVPSGFA